MRKAPFVLLFFLFPQFAHAQPMSVHTVGMATSPVRGVLDIPIGEISANPQGAAVIDKDIPGLLSNPNYSSIKVMSLKMVASLSGGRLTEEMLAKTQSDLKALPDYPVMMQSALQVPAAP